MKTSDIGLVFDNKLSRQTWANIVIEAGTPDTMWFGTVPTDIGAITVIGSDDALCYLGFEERRSLEKCAAFFPRAELVKDRQQAEVMVHKILDIWTGKNIDLRILVNGTPFQHKVWGALMYIPTGAAVSYGTIAHSIGTPKAVRAVGTAVGANPVSLLIPCHRVVQQSGKVENYGWGDAMKHRLLTHEVSMRISKNPSSRKIPQVA